MKDITMFSIEACPYCKEAQRWMEMLFVERPEYRGLRIEVIDEQVFPDIAAKFDYYYVPTYYVGGEKLHEGAASLKKIRRVFEAAMGD